MFNFFRRRVYSLHKSRTILKTGYAWYKKNGGTLSVPLLAKLEDTLSQLDQAILNKNRDEASRLAHELESFGNSHFKKSFFEYASELVIALAFALIIATLVRQVWFELYEIPTGSMRPTFREQDHLTVSKLAFGINVPLEPNHFYFDPSLVQRSSVVIFTGENIPLIDQDTNYFWVLPYKKRYIKRMIAKPGDSIYFYGGKLYVLDQENHLNTDLLEAPWMQHLEHLPFLTFEGLISAPTGAYVLFKQSQQPIGKLSPTATGLLGEVNNGKGWIKDDPNAQKSAHNVIKTYSDLFGIRNFAMARLLTRDQLDPDLKEGLEQGVLYLELRHTPSLTYPKPRIQQNAYGFGVSITPYKTVIPLQQRHLDALMNHMYTARFVVSNGKAARYNIEGNHFGKHSPIFENIPDGTYEYYFGKAFKVGFGGILTELPATHPLYSHEPSFIQKLYNLGIEMNTEYAPESANPFYFPQRYAYFRNGDLYLLGAPILKKEDPVLRNFASKESEREKQTEHPYVAFKDYGPPLKEDGTPDVEFIRTFGLTVPKQHYYVLGDNHAMSSDSRVFGFVPQNNLQGAPSLIIWPPGDRLGAPAQKPYPIVNLSRMIIWTLAAIIIAIWYAYHRYRLTQPIYKKINR